MVATKAVRFPCCHSDFRVFQIGHYLNRSHHRANHADGGRIGHPWLQTPALNPDLAVLGCSIYFHDAANGAAFRTVNHNSKLFWTNRPARFLLAPPAPEGRFLRANNAPFNHLVEAVSRLTNGVQYTQREWLERMLSSARSLSMVACQGNRQ